ncbi:MAG: ribose-5-phosphate isomerase RpiA [Caldilineales bacterium]
MNAVVPPANPQAAFKIAAAERAADLVQNGMTVGLGTGSTAIHATRRIGELLRHGELRDIRAIATSRATHEAALSLGIPLLPDALPVMLDLTIDGADEIDPALNLIKGGGGALLREKIVAEASRRLVIVADESKLSPQLGTHWPVPVEVLAFGWQSQARFVETLGARWTLRRQADGSEFRTDSGHLILDCAFGPISDAVALAAVLAGRAGIVEHGLFLGVAAEVFVAGRHGVQHLTRL